MYGFNKWWNSDEETAKQTIAIAKAFYGTDRTVKAYRLSDEFKPPRLKWYQRIGWLQKLARMIVAD